MKNEEKAEKFSKLTEAELRQQVLIPLLKAIGFSDVYEFHGSNEKGKDLIFREVSRLKEIIVHAAVVSKNDITGEVGDSKSAERILDQVRMTLEEPYVDLYTGRKTYIDRCWVITSGRILATAIDSISGHLKRSHLDKLVRFLDGTRVIGLLDEAYPQYWERKSEFAYYSRHEAIDISCNQLDPPYNRELDNLPDNGNLKNSVHEIKKNVYRLMLTIEFEIMDKFASILRSNHPWEIISIWEELEGNRINRDGHISLGSETRKIQSYWEYLLDDISVYEKQLGITRDDRKIPEGNPGEKG